MIGHGAHGLSPALASLSVLLFVVACATPAPTAPPIAIAPPQAATAVPPTLAPTKATQMVLAPCDTGALAISALEPSATVTLGPTTAPSPSATGGPTLTPRPPTATPRPAQQTDRVGFPEGFQDKFKFLFISDRVATKQIRQVCANDIAAAVKPGEAYPYGGVLIFESWRPKEDASGNVITDAKGHLIRDALTTIFVMRKEQGYGEAYGNLRNGEWEYIAYRPDKSVATAPANTASCAACDLAGKANDFVLRTDLMAAKDRYGQTPAIGPNEVGMASVAGAPTTLKVRVGITVNWKNDDNIDHTVVATDGAFHSGILKPFDSYSFNFTKPGTYEYVCALHPEQMQRKVQVGH